MRVVGGGKLAQLDFKTSRNSPEGKPSKGVNPESSKTSMKKRTFGSGISMRQVGLGEN